MLMRFVKGGDVMEVEILKDCSIKIETEAISSAQHTEAENIIDGIVAAAGGPSSREKTAEGMTHQHEGHYHTH